MTDHLPPKWLRWTLLALFSWGLWAIMARLVGEALSGAHSQALSALGMLPILLFLGLVKKPAPHGNWRSGVLLAFSGGAISCFGNVLYYEALSRGGKAAVIVPLTALYPLVTILLGVVVLRERLKGIQLGGGGVSLVAIYFFNLEAEQTFSSFALLPTLVPITLWGTSAFLQKLSTRQVPAQLSTLCFLGASIPFAVAFMVQAPLPSQIPLLTWGFVLAQGFFLGLGSFAVLAAFAAQGKASIVTPLAALYPLVSIPIAIVCLGERVNVREAFGICLALAAALALAHRSQESHNTCADRKDNLTQEH